MLINFQGIPSGEQHLVSDLQTRPRVATSCCLPLLGPNLAGCNQAIIIPEWGSRESSQLDKGLFF